MPCPYFFNLHALARNPRKNSPSPEQVRVHPPNPKILWQLRQRLWPEDVREFQNQAAVIAQNITHFIDAFFRPNEIPQNSNADHSAEGTFLKWEMLADTDDQMEIPFAEVA